MRGIAAALPLLRRLGPVAPKQACPRPHPLLPHVPERALRPRPGSRRPFVSSPWSSDTQTLHASRVLSYPSSALFHIIADVQSYSSFVPYCQESKVTSWSAQDDSGKRWPKEAQLRVGWAGVEEQFTSAVYCVPDSVVEAVGGEAEPTIPPRQLSHYAESSAASHSSDTLRRGSDGSVFKYLLTRWSVNPFPFKPPPQESSPQEAHTTLPSREQTDVSLVIEFQFSNPVYATMSKAVAPKVAGMMMEAFENRARAVLGEPATGDTKQVSDEAGRLVS
ncbi:MAG: hypothetical protein M1833_006533 [Piccolia ochrophora]|nr:MAG: hypothetical protein M1833_006533 [Piccolia ochrophora]